jgi:tetratricopeptide (TPR) repeat protein
VMRNHSDIAALMPQMAVAYAESLTLVGETERGAVELERALALANEMYGEGIQTGIRNAQALVATLQGDIDSAIDHLRWTYEASIEQGDVAHGSSSAGWLGAVLAEHGDEMDEAARLLERCRVEGGDDDALNQILWRRGEAILAARAGDAARARSLLDEAVTWSETTDELMERADLWLSRATVEQMGGDLDAARAALDRAEECYRQKGAVLGVERVARRRAELDAAR